VAPCCTLPAGGLGLPPRVALTPWHSDTVLAATACWHTGTLGHGRALTAASPRQEEEDTVIQIFLSQPVLGRQPQGLHTTSKVMSLHPRQNGKLSLN